MTFAKMTWLAGVVVVGGVLGGCRTVPVQTQFGTPEAAVESLVASLRQDDEKALTAILGPDAEIVLSSGDENDDRAGRAKFLEFYDEKNQLVRDGDSKVEIVIGKLEWPFPVPVVRTKERWVFDVTAGKEEVLDRRIGRNELQSVQVLLAIVDAQREYAQKDRDGDGLLEYAAKFRSTPGAKDGLYWTAAEGEGQSPLGLFAAKAQEEHYTAKSPEAGPQPYHGYLYRILLKQGKSATGGAYEYMANDSMMGGFAVIATPAEYGNSGVMTFMISYEGGVYQKDLGPDTAEIAAEIESFDPDSSWKKMSADVK